MTTEPLCCASVCQDLTEICASEAKMAPSPAVTNSVISENVFLITATKRVFATLAIMAMIVLLGQRLLSNPLMMTPQSKSL